MWNDYCMLVSTQAWTRTSTPAERRQSNQLKKHSVKTESEKADSCHCGEVLLDYIFIFSTFDVKKKKKL